MKTVFVGLEGSGKTALMSVEAHWIVERNRKLYEKTGIKRPIVSNIRFSKQFEDYARGNDVPIRYWKDVDELDKLTECDLFIDELGAYFDSRTFSDLPLTTRLWLAQAQKLGVHIWGGAQDWGQVDVAFRRLASRIFDVKKFIGTRRPSKTFPPGKNPWAIIFAWRVKPFPDRDSLELKAVKGLIPMPIPTFHFFTTKHFSRFDTNARVEDSSPPPLKKIVRVCPEDGYIQVRYR